MAGDSDHVDFSPDTPPLVQDSPDAAQPSSFPVEPAPVPRAEPVRHAKAKPHRRGEPGGVVGVIFGTVSTTRFRCRVTAPLEKTEYVMVKHPLDGMVLGQVMEIHLQTNLTAEDAAEIASGTAVDREGLRLAEVSLLGFRDGRGLLQSPQTPLEGGSKVLRADESFIRKVLGLKEHSPTGAYLGLLRNHSLRVELDLNSLVQKHVAILAQSGSGKSYCAAALVEELMKHDATVLIIDAHGEYSSLRERGKVEQRTDRDFGVSPRGYASQILEYTTSVELNPKAKPLKFTLHILDARELLGLTNIRNIHSFLSVLRKTLDALRTAKPEYTLQDVIAALEAHEEASVGQLITELEYLNEIDLFAERGTRIDELVRSGKTTILSLKGTPPDIQELVVNRILTAVFELRKHGKVSPLMVLVEEAHNFCPQQGTKACSKIFRTIASEGRKFGLGLCIISQRAARVDKNVLSQCNTQIILKVHNPNDLKAIAASIEGLTEGMENEIQLLPIGTAIVTGGGLQIPLFLEIRPRETAHGGESVNIIPTR